MSFPDSSLLGTRRLGAPRRLTKTASFLRFFLVDLSRRKAVLLRGGPLWKGLGGIITYTSTPFAPPFLWHFGALRLFLYMQNVVIAELGHVVVLLLGTVVPRALAVVPAPGAVVPQVPTVVLLGNMVISKKILRTRKIMVMHGNERGEYVYVPS